MSRCCRSLDQRQGFPNLAEPLTFSPRLLWPNSCMDQDATWYGGTPRFTRHCVRWGPSCPSHKRTQPPIFGNVRCGQTAGWIKMALGTEVGLSPGDFVLDGDPATSPKMGRSPRPKIFMTHVYCVQTAGCIKTALGNGGRPKARRLCVR